jgi:superfamily II DNA/RNA helicase
LPPLLSSTLIPGITHGLISTPRMRALEMLKKFLKAKPEVVSALIFVNDPHRVEIIYEKLLEMGFVAAPLHGESSKDDRKVFPQPFKKNRFFTARPLFSFFFFL